MKEADNQERSHAYQQAVKIHIHLMLLFLYFRGNVPH
jgi:hypothetical protein